jgi:DNA ligase-1
MKYSKLCKVYEKLESTSKRLEKTEILAGFLKELKKEKDKQIIYLLRGRIFPDYDEREIGISNKLVIKAMVKAIGSSKQEINNLWKDLGDLGSVAEKITSKKKQSTLSKKTLTVEKVLDNLQKLPKFEGKGTIDKKINLISELLTAAEPIEARYLVRTILGDLRIGIGEGTLRDSIAWECFDKDDKKAYDIVQNAYDKSTDFAVVFEKACKSKKELESLNLQPGKPAKVMLFLKEDSIEEGFDRVGKPALIEYKYDGFRMMINKFKENSKTKIKIFTRRLDEVTKQFPEVKEYVKKYVKGSSFILDAEAVGYDPKTKTYKPFQEISHRIKRKYDINKIAKELPIEVNVFDILYYNGKSFIQEPLKKRRQKIDEIVKNKKYKIKTAKSIKTSNIEKAKKFYDKALSEGEEGIMMKNLEAPYKPGSRVGYGIKIKPEAREFDLVIVKGEYGTGKRAGWITSYTVACKSNDKLLELGKVSTGLKEKSSEGLSFKELTKKLKPLIKKEKGRQVEVSPKIVVTVMYQNIQKSPTYESGYALRFPRITRLRPDRGVEDIAKLREIKKEHEK